MRKKAFQQGRSKWSAETYPLRYVEVLHEARTPLGASASCYRLHHQPATGLNHLTCQPTCLLTRQECHHIGDIRGMPESFEG